MAEHYLLEVLSKLSAAKETKAVVKTVFDKLLSKTLEVVKKKHLEQTHANVKVTNKKKEKLNSSPSAKVVLSSQNREEMFTDFKHKEMETKEFVKKLKREQKERERRLKEREEEERAKLAQEEKQQERRRLEAVERAEEEKNRRVRNLQEKSYKRKQEIRDLIELGNQEYKKVMSAKPMHEKIEEKYLIKVLMPELERHKHELAKKRELLQPINRSAILEHAKKHDQLIEDHNLQKRNTSQEAIYNASKLRSKYTLAYIEENKKRRYEQQLEIIEKKNLIEKKKQYSELVLEMYQPTVDPAKQLELKIIKEKLRDSSVQISRKRSTKSLSGKEGLSDSENIQRVKRKWKKNPMIPEVPKKKEPVKVDWLAEQREIKKGQQSTGRLEKIDFDSGVSNEKIKAHVKMLENEARKREIKLEVANPSNSKGIAATEHVSNMLIDSIKGKLAILEHS